MSMKSIKQSFVDSLDTKKVITITDKEMETNGKDITQDIELLGDKLYEYKSKTYRLVATDNIKKFSYYVELKKV